MPFGSIFTTKTPITAAHLLNDRVLSFYEQHPYKLYLVVNDIDHTKTKARALQTNGICERFHKTLLQAFYRHCQSKSAWAGKGSSVASSDAKSLPLFQQFSRGHSPRGPSRRPGQWRQLAA